jgi:Leucine-rich repeat (LRR) protein
MTAVSNLAPLAGLKRLEELHLNSTQVSDVGALTMLKSLKSLDLSDTLTSDLAPLAELDNLEVLNLTKTQVSDLKPLTNVGRLKTLYIGPGFVTPPESIISFWAGQPPTPSPEIPESQIKNLQNALPNLNIRRVP